MITKRMREKYASRDTEGRTRFRLAGGLDVLALCDVVDDLVRLVHEMQPCLPIDRLNMAETRLWNIVGDLPTTRRRHD